MPRQGQSKAQANRAMRQEALRETLSSQGHIQHVIENITKSKRELDRIFTYKRNTKRQDKAF